MLGTYALSAGYYDAYYLKAQQVRTLIRRDFDAGASQRCDALVDAGRADDRVPARREDRRPAHHVPLRHLHDLGEPGRPARRSSSRAASTAAGLPIGLQLIGRPFDEATVLRVGARLRAARPTGTAGGRRHERPDRLEAVIGLEVHAELLTRVEDLLRLLGRVRRPRRTRNVCPVCLGMPGVLPVLNRRVVEFAIRAGLATDCTIAPRSRFARKNYFYPDLPKGYQISMYELPLCIGG